LHWILESDKTYVAGGYSHLTIFRAKIVIIVSCVSVIYTR